MIYCKVENGAVVDRAIFAGAMPDDWPERERWRASDAAQVGWSFDGAAFVPPAPPAADPPPRRLAPKSTIVDRLHAAGKLAAAKAAIDSNLYVRERWYAPDKPAVYADDPETLGLLAAIGADPAVILAP